ncbi:unnamed protein product [Caenorhabditis angaria]|uniref:Tyrosine-protein phosphatase domain-containing protein n=1 Tax=Caenorhabditis angaria TaxID=860376 RepID=A0A9P1ILG3_9PELO|nr:unnamed protein product [Caenorhabditis angaria]
MNKPRRKEDNKKKTQNDAKSVLIRSSDEKGGVKKINGGGELTKRASLTRSIAIDWAADFSNQIDLKMCDFVEKVLKIETETTLSAYFLNNLINVQPDDNTYTKFRENPTKNRNNDVFCTDTTRVRLKTDKSDASDYIHANYISIENSNKAFIASQHPLPNTIGDFWSMVYNENVEVIVNLTNLVGPDYPIYYPTRRGENVEYGQYQIGCKSVRIGAHKHGPTIFVIDLKQIGTSRANEVHIIRYQFWPKNMVPESVKVLLLIERFLSRHQRHAPPLIQCETGVNQSAVFVFVEAMHTHLMENRFVDIEAVFTNIRKQRMAAITQKVHFIYSIYTILSIIRMRFTMRNKHLNVIRSIDTIEQQLYQQFAKQISEDTSDTRQRSPTPAELLPS